MEGRRKWRHGHKPRKMGLAQAPVVEHSGKTLENGAAPYSCVATAWTKRPWRLPTRRARTATRSGRRSVPVTIKVNTDQKDHPTDNGVVAFHNLIAPDGAPVVANLRTAGAVIIGRTNVPAFSMREFSENDLHGRTLNPRDREVTPGGSSGGAGTAVGPRSDARGAAAVLAGIARRADCASAGAGRACCAGRRAWRASQGVRLCRAVFARTWRSMPARLSRPRRASSLRSIRRGEHVDSYERLILHPP